MKSLRAGTLKDGDIQKLVSKIATEHLRDIFETVILGEGRNEAVDVLFSKGKTEFGVTGTVTCSNDEGGFALLFVEGDLLVRGSLTIEDDPPAFLVVTGNLVVEDSLVAAGWVEVQGSTEIRGALAGDYNHGEAHLCGDVSAAVFLDGGDYPFSFDGSQTFGRTVKDGKVIDSILGKIRDGKPWSLPKEKKEKTFAELVKGKADAAFTPYKPTLCFKKGALLRHAEYGPGIVVKVVSTMYIEVLFADDKRTLAHKGW